MAWWSPQPGGPLILSGRDLSGGGTWLGLNEAGHLALVTQVREPGPTLPVSPSRGELVTRWLTGQSDLASLQSLGAERRNGFNLLATDLSADPLSGASASRAWCLSNRPAVHQSALGLGLHGLSNASLDTPWPKLTRLKRSLQQALTACGDLPALVARGLAALSDRTPAPADQLPETGWPRNRELQHSPVFIHIHGDWSGQDYGTRCSTVVVVEHLAQNRWVHVVERTFDHHAEPVGEVQFDHRLPSPAAAVG